ncbi:MAG TPA: hypothetical protein DEW46_04540 [Verrucomicrobia bacterium]|nr:hypothetical protein [Verrucomicrobiota bacterium]
MIGLLVGLASLSGIISEQWSGGPPQFIRNQIEVEAVSHEGRAAATVQFQRVDWPNLFFQAGPDQSDVWDWSQWDGLAIDVYNPGAEPVRFAIRVDNPGADGVQNCSTTTFLAEPGVWTTAKAWFSQDTGPFWGMRGIPERGPVGSSATVDRARIHAFQLFLPKPDRLYSLTLADVRLIRSGGGSVGTVEMPFVNRFGQYRHADWPGKLKGEEEWAVRIEREAADWEANPPSAQLDAYGGWLEGPQLEATGWFRTQELDGRWWLVTPTGHLFFSLGIDCVANWESTFIEGRTDWFEWLPEESSPYGGFYGYARNVHSMAERIGGEGRTFSFYRANLMRKYGADWPERWRRSVYHRLPSWGFNTIGNWSQGDVVEASPIPFVATASIGGDFRLVEGGTGYWSKPKDVFDPGFAEAVGRSLSRAVAAWRDNPLCIGYFVDNELAWDGLMAGALASPEDQPCRRYLVDQLQAKYGSLEALEEAWGRKFGSWSEVRYTGEEGPSARGDAAEFEMAFARRYFELISEELGKAAPNQLYLGCRFSGAPVFAVKACAEYADVVSFNIYQARIACEEIVQRYGLAKPAIIGEFHFGALDRGMFHQGLVPVQSQAQRAEAYRQYVRSVLECPVFVGCHWFQFVDEPITGRTHDGENYNIGFVDVTDQPYPEMIEAARSIHGEAYQLRMEGVGPADGRR